jgi:hypothetical protein
MKAFNDSRENSSRELASSFSSTEKWPRTAGPDERNQTGILTSNSSLAPAFPIFSISGLGSLSFVTVA